VFQNRELRRIFGPKKGEVKRGMTKLNKEGISDCTLRQELLERSSGEDEDIGGWTI
jgi:hypothetical protein